MRVQEEAEKILNEAKLHAPPGTTIDVRVSNEKPGDTKEVRVTCPESTVAREKMQRILS